jgi:hypothetical protein
MEKVKRNRVVMRQCKTQFRYANAERMRNPLAGAERMAERASAFSLGVSQAKLHFGMQMWSVCKPAGGLVGEQAALSQTQGIEAEFTKRS